MTVRGESINEPAHATEAHNDTHERFLTDGHNHKYRFVEVVERKKA